MKKYWILILIFSSFSCQKDDAATSSSASQIEQWLSQTGITSSSKDQETGIYYYAETTSSGATVSTGNVAAIYYTLFDLEDNILASHQRVEGDSLLLKHNVAAVFPIGVNFAIGVMRVGEVYQFLLPPSQAYKDVSNSILNNNMVYRLQIELAGAFSESDVYAQELIHIEDYINQNNLNDTIVNPIDRVEQFGSGISYKRMIAGSGNLALNGDTLIINYNGKFLRNGQSFESRDGFEWIYGSDQPRPLFPGFEFGISIMQVNEQALFMIPSSQAYRESALIIPDFIGPNLVENRIIPEYVTSVSPYQSLLFTIRRIR